MLTKFFSVKNKNNIMDVERNGMMEVIDEILPKENSFPANTEQAKKLINNLA